MTTIIYDTWPPAGHPGSRQTLQDEVRAALGPYYRGYDIPRLTAAYRAAINTHLPDGVSLADDDAFYGPDPKQDVNLAEAIKAVDFRVLAGRHSVDRH